VSRVVPRFRGAQLTSVVFSVSRSTSHARRAALRTWARVRPHGRREFFMPPRGGRRDRHIFV